MQKTQKTRLDKILTQAGYGTRSEVHRLVKAGRVTVDAQVTYDYATQISIQKVEIDNEEVPYSNSQNKLDKHKYFALHKPVGYICTNSQGEGISVFSLVPEEFRAKLKCVGRLDKESSGLLLLSDDGNFIHHCTHPRKHLPKIYFVRVSNPIPAEAKTLFASGTFMLKDETEPLKPAELTILDSHTALIQIHEGRYHQVRRMFEEMGTSVIELRRDSIGGLKLDLVAKSGDFVKLGAQELELVGYVFT